MLKGVVLNDIGPVIEAKGLMRIRGYVGKLPAPASWPDAVDLARRVMSAQFTALSDAEWERYARLTFEEKDGRFLPRYDPALAKTLETVQAKMAAHVDAASASALAQALGQEPMNPDNSLESAEDALELDRSAEASSAIDQAEAAWSAASS